MRKNVQAGERALTMAVGAYFLRRSMRRQGLGALPSLVAGGVLAVRGLTGYCRVYEALGIPKLVRRPLGKAGESSDFSLRMQRSILIRRAQQEVFDFISRFESYAPFLDKTESLYRRGGGNRKWTLVLPFGKRLRFDLITVKSNAPLELVLRSSADADNDLQYECRISVEEGFADRHSLLRVNLGVQPGTRFFVQTIAAALSNVLEGFLAESLRLIKYKMEAGEIPSTVGQPQGGRLAKAATSSMQACLEEQESRGGELAASSGEDKGAAGEDLAKSGRAG